MHFLFDNNIMKYISLGSGCAPKQNIINHTQCRDCLFFDWLSNDFVCANYVLNNINNPDDVILNPANFIHKNNFIVNTKIKMLSSHDKPENISFDEYLPTFIEKYKAKLNRLKNLIVENDDLTFIYLITEESMRKYILFPDEPRIMTVDDLHNFFATIERIKGKKGNVNLTIAVMPTLNKYFDEIRQLNCIDGVKVHFLQENGCKNDWCLSHLDFDKIFVQNTH